MPDAFDHCEQLVREADRDRYLATLFAPQKHRRPLHALYAFDIEIQSVRERAREPMPGEIRLQWWRDVLGGVGRGEVDANPVAAALRETIVRYRLPPKTILDLIDAHTFDLYDEPMASLVGLERYAMLTSSSVIGLAARILNDGREPGMADVASHAGIAFAIASLLRALPLHAAHRQLYLPADVLERYGAAPADIFAGQATTELRSALAELRLWARQHLTEVGAGIADMPIQVMPALLPIALVRPALDRMERRGYQPFRPDEIPQWRRQWILWRAARRNLRNAF